jgi:hypothetical protein
MLRAILLVALALLFGGCDPLYSVTSSRLLASSPDRQCVIDALRMQDVVHSVHVTGEHVYANLVIPLDPAEPDGMASVNVDVQGRRGRDFEIRFYVVWIGREPSADLREHWQEILDDLRDRVMKRCGD